MGQAKSKAVCPCGVVGPARGMPALLDGWSARPGRGGKPVWSCAACTAKRQAAVRRPSASVRTEAHAIRHAEPKREPGTERTEGHRLARLPMTLGMMVMLAMAAPLHPGDDR